MHTYVIGGYWVFFGIGAILLVTALVLQINAQNSVEEAGGNPVPDLDGKAAIDAEKRANLQSWASFATTVSLISFVLSVPGAVVKAMK